MRKALPAVCVVLCAALALGILLQAGAAALLRAALRHAFPGAQVRVAGCSIWPLSRISVRGADIRSKTFHCALARMRVRYVPAAAWPPLRLRVQLDDLSCDISTGDVPLVETVRGYMPAGKPAGLPVETIVCERGRLSVQSVDLAGEVFFNAVIDPGRRVVERVDVRVPLLRWRQVEVCNAFGSADLSGPGGIRIESLTAGNARAGNLCMRTLLTPGRLQLCEGRAEAFGGMIAFNGFADAADPLRSSIDLRVERLDIAAAVQAFKWQEKLRASGYLDGQLRVGFLPQRGLDLAGTLLARQPGGSLDIRERRFLEYIAQGSGQPVEIIAQSLADYRYDQGSLSVSRQEDGFALKALLSGPQGKRDLTVVIHAQPQGG